MRPGVSTRFLFLPASVLVIVAVIALSFSAHAHADSVALYATSCLGGWENSAYATGMPDVRDVDASVLFSESNSAVLRPNTQTQLYCGGFTGDVIENTVPVDIRVTFSWDAEFPADVLSKPAAPESVPESVLPSVETAPDTVPEVAPTTELVPEATSAEPVDESAPASDVVSEPELAPVPESVQEPTSWLWRVLGTVVFAQEVSGGEQENTEAISETVSNEELTDVPAPALIEENTTVTADDAVSTEVAPYGIVEVLYTLNGVEWKSLGYVRKNDFSRTSFEIPVTEASDWEGISQIQIEVRTVPTMNQVDPTIYLDAVWLEVEYEGAVNAETDRVPDIYAMPTDFPDINTATVHAFRGFNDRVATIVERDAIPALFVGHRIENGYTIEQVSTGSNVRGDSPIGIKDGRVFWLDTQGNIWSFRFEDGVYFMRHPVEVDDSMQVTFDAFPWRIIYRGGNFYFTSSDTGEIVSDDDTTLYDSFAQTFVGAVVRDDLVQTGLSQDAQKNYEDTPPQE